MTTYTCDNCKENYDYELPICPGCLNETFDIEELSACCGVSLLSEIDNDNIYTIQDKTTIYGIDDTNGIDRTCKVEGEMKDGVLNIMKIDYDY